LTATDPDALYHQKVILITVVVAAAIIGILTVTTLIVLISIIADKVTHKLRQRAQRDRYELIPTYHNVRALRTLDPNFNYSCESILPPPPIPSAPPEELENTRQQQTVITFKQ